MANPGCYPTAAILSLAPLLKFNLIAEEIIVDAKSGISGAGRKKALELSQQAKGNFKAYKVGIHQHTPEIVQQLFDLSKKNFLVNFVPHLLPIKRGILETIYVRKKKVDLFRKKDVRKIYREFYKDKPFVRIKEENIFPEIRDVVGTNFCDIGIHEEKKHLIIISVIDNLLKGASGQAVQNMNIMYGFEETLGLECRYCEEQNYL